MNAHRHIAPSFRAGFTAVEVLSAVMLLGLALAPVMSLFPSGARQAAFSEAHAVAQARAEQALDEWVELATAGKFVDQAIGSPLTPDAQPSPDDPIRVLVTALEVDGKPGLWRVSAEADWTSTGAVGVRPSALVLERLYSRPTLSLEFDPEPESAGPSGASTEETHS